MSLQQVHSLCHNMLQYHNYRNAHLLSQPFWQIEEREGCRCRERAGKSLCSFRTENKEKTFISFEIVQRNLYTMGNRGCFVSLTQVVSEDVISTSSDSSGKGNVISQKSFQKE